MMKKTSLLLFILFTSIVYVRPLYAELDFDSLMDGHSTGQKGSDSDIDSALGLAPESKKEKARPKTRKKTTPTRNSVDAEFDNIHEERHKRETNKAHGLLVTKNEKMARACKCVLSGRACVSDKSYDDWKDTNVLGKLEDEIRRDKKSACRTWQSNIKNAMPQSLDGINKAIKYVDDSLSDFSKMDKRVSTKIASLDRKQKKDRYRVEEERRAREWEEIEEARRERKRKKSKKKRVERDEFDEHEYQAELKRQRRRQDGNDDGVSAVGLLARQMQNGWVPDALNPNNANNRQFQKNMDLGADLYKKANENRKRKRQSQLEEQREKERARQEQLSRQKQAREEKKAEQRRRERNQKNKDRQNQPTVDSGKRKSGSYQSAKRDKKPNGCWTGYVSGTSCLIFEGSKEKGNKLLLKYRNSCGQRIYMKSCAKGSNGKWSCGATGIRAGKTYTFSYFNATGDHVAKSVGSKNPGEDWTCKSESGNWDGP